MKNCYSRATMRGRLTQLNRILGPSLLMAAAAVGVSHLVQSTRAGAGYGFQLVGLVVLVNVLKYPFFEFGQRYAAATGESMLDGYRRVGRGTLAVFLAMSFVTMIICIIVVTMVCAGLAGNLIGVIGGDHALLWWTIIMLLVCNGVLAFGKYAALDSVTKVVVAMLSLATLVAVICAFASPAEQIEGFESPSPWNLATLGFLIALMGWMPAPIELSVWPSLWIKERREETGFQPTVRQARFDFNVGYIGAIILAVAFVSLGALVMHGTGVTFSNSAVAFAGELESMFGRAIGSWIQPVIAIAAFTAMFSTTLTCLDGYPRSISEGFQVIAPGRKMRYWPVYWALNVLACICTVLVVSQYLDHMRELIDLVTAISFLSAPVFAFINLRVVQSGAMPSEHRPGRMMTCLSWLGLAFLAGFSILWIASVSGLIE